MAKDYTLTEMQQVLREYFTFVCDAKPTDEPQCARLDCEECILNDDNDGQCKNTRAWNITNELIAKVEEYNKSRQWLSVAVDTPVIVDVCGAPERHHFAHYSPITDEVFVWMAGKTSFTANHQSLSYEAHRVRLATNEEKERNV